MIKKDTSNMTPDELQAYITELEQAVGTRKPQSLTFSVAKQGGVSVLGLQSFPVTLYFDQWMRLLEGDDHTRLLAFLKQQEAAGKLARKKAA